MGIASQAPDCSTDFCLWSPPNPDSAIADTEGEEVAWCAKKGYGTRIMEEGTITGAQLLKTDQYWMITGLINQTLLNMQSNDRSVALVYKCLLTQNTGEVR